jgi:hypothetical protein
MFNIIFGFFILLLWVGCLVFSILALVFRKYRTAKVILVSIAVFLGALPFLLFFLINLEHDRQQSAYCGEFLAGAKGSREIKLALFDDGTFVLESEQCSGRIEGTWDNQNGDVGDYVDFSPTHGYLSQASITMDRVGFLNPIQLGDCELGTIVLERRPIF